MYHEGDGKMGSKAPYYYSELKADAIASNESVPNPEQNNLNKAENPYERGHGFDNPLLAIEPDVSIGDVPKISKPKGGVFQKKKKKKKFPALGYRKSGSVIENELNVEANHHKKLPSALDSTIHSSFVVNRDKILSHHCSEPNIYEEITDPIFSGPSSSSGYAHWSASKPYDPEGFSLYSSKVEHEKAQKRHVQILENLNLEVEAMLMPKDVGLGTDSAAKLSDYSAAINISKNADLYASSHLQNSAASGVKNEAAQSNYRVMNEYILQQEHFCTTSQTSGTNTSAQGENYLKEPLYMLYDDRHRHIFLSRDSLCRKESCSQLSLFGGSSVDMIKSDSKFEDYNLYNGNKQSDVMPSEINDLMEDADALSWTGSDSNAIACSEDIYEEIEDFATGSSHLLSMNTDEKVVSGGFRKWFSSKRSWSNESGKAIRLKESQKGCFDGKIPKKQRPPLSLPPVPQNLTANQTKRRYIIKSIIDSENSYLNSLERLIKDYRNPLLESYTTLINPVKVKVMFHNVEHILHCHRLFGIALSQYIREWDQNEKIGSVFAKSFTKNRVLDIYSDFINNFSNAMEEAKHGINTKPAFAEYLKEKQINSEDRLSFFGLMVKPIQRFPQFILMLQDLLKATPPGHADRLALQIALTHLESFTFSLNERKRESEQRHSVKKVLQNLGKYSSHKNTCFLLREDDVYQCILDSQPSIEKLKSEKVKSKARRLFLLSDQLFLVTVSPQTNNGKSREKMKLKWSVPLQDVEVYNIGPGTMYYVDLDENTSKHISVGSHIKPSSAKLLLDEVTDLVHDLEVANKMQHLATSIRNSYSEFTIDHIQNMTTAIQEKLAQKNDEVFQRNHCLYLTIRSKSQHMCFRFPSPSAKRDWTTDLRLAQLALDSNNNPGWDFTFLEKQHRIKMPLFVSSSTMSLESCNTEFRCGCQLIIKNPVVQQYLFLCCYEEDNNISTILTLVLQGIYWKTIRTYSVSKKINAIESVPGLRIEKDSSSFVLSRETVWIGTECQKILLFDGLDPKDEDDYIVMNVNAPVTQIKYYYDQVFVALYNGSVLIYQRNSDGYWYGDNPTTINLGDDAVTCLLPINSLIYCACAEKIWIIDSVTHNIERSYKISKPDQPISSLVYSGTGLFVTFKDSTSIILYHIESFKQMQHIHVEENILWNLSQEQKKKIREENSDKFFHVTSILATKGLLWAATKGGHVLVATLPRLEGLPLICGPRMIPALHCHQGPVQLLLSLQPKYCSPIIQKVITERDSPKISVTKQASDSILPSTSFNSSQAVKPIDADDVHASGVKSLPRTVSLCTNIAGDSAEETNNVYGLYADLMNIKDYEKDGGDPIYECLDPQAVYVKLSTLDRKMKQQPTPSWDLTTMSVSEDSDSSNAYDSSAHKIAFETTIHSGNTSEPLPKSVVDVSLTEQNNSSPMQAIIAHDLHKLESKMQSDFVQKTLLVLTGGSGYKKVRNMSDTISECTSHYNAQITFWEVKV